VKRLRITLDNKVYEVTVEILEDDETHYPGSPAAAQGWVPPTPAPSAPPPAPAPHRRPVPPSSSGDVLAPIVGTVRKILVETGSEVRENQPLMVLDAMKMDTYINAPHAGTIDQILCKIGDSVQAGQKVMSFQ